VFDRACSIVGVREVNRSSVALMQRSASNEGIPTRRAIGGEGG
jgi:hypothetical protein